MNIIRQLFEIILNRRQPEDISYNTNAASIICLIFLLSYYFQLNTISEFTNPFRYALVLVGGHIIAYALLLKTHNKENRLVQTLTSFFGTNLILYIPIIIIAPIQGLSIIGVFIQLYSVIISVRILKSSFSCPTYLAIIIYISVTLFSIILLFILCPSAPQEYIQHAETMTNADIKTPL